jgi:hypothetical protein
MSRDSATQAAQISKQIEEVTERPQIGRVVEVYEHVLPDDDSNFEVDVRLLRNQSKQFRAIPWQTPQTDEVKVPRVGDKVVVEYHGKSKKTPKARAAVHTNEDRAPKGIAGVWRKKMEGGPSPAGDGDLYIESNTEYETSAASPEFVKDDATVDNSYVRIAKKDDDRDTTNFIDDIPMLIEMVDDPANDAAHVRVELNRLDGSESPKKWGLLFDLKSGEFKILDSNGYGIVSDGSGNFDWFYESLDYKQGQTTSL